MLRTLAAVALLATTSVPTAARAEYVSDFATWQALSGSARLGFVSGAMDRLLITMSEDDGWAALYDGVRACIYRVRPNSGALEQAVTDTYRANPELWGMSAILVLYYVVHRMCATEINERRQAAGLAPVSAATLLANMKRPPTRSGP